MSDMYFLPQPFPPFDKNGGGGGNQGPSGWTALANGKTIGNSAVIDFDNANVNQSSVNILEVSGQDKDSLQLSITFAPPLFAPPGSDAFQDNHEVLTAPNSGYANGVNSPLLANVLGVILWGSGGNSNKAVVDINNGATVNLSASFVRVMGLVDNRTIAGESMRYRIGAQISPGHTIGGGATCTVPVASDLGVNVESAVFPVPRFAKTVTVLGSSIIAGPPPGVVGTLFTGWIRFWHSPTGPLVGTHNGELLYAGNVGNSLPVRIPNGANYFTIMSGIAAPNHIMAVFDLSI